MIAVLCYRAGIYQNCPGYIISCRKLCFIRHILNLIFIFFCLFLVIFWFFSYGILSSYVICHLEEEYGGRHSWKTVIYLLVTAWFVFCILITHFKTTYTISIFQAYFSFLPSGRHLFIYLFPFWVLCQFSFRTHLKKGNEKKVEELKVNWAFKVWVAYF